MTLTKAHLIEAVSQEDGFTRKKSIETVETLLKIIKGTLESGEDVMISNFGKFCVKGKKERRGRNPGTGEELIIAPRRIVTFRCSKKLKDMINP